MNKLEKELQAKILRKINKIHGVVAFANVVTGYSPTGHADIYGTVYGFSLWAEVKLDPDEEPTRIQRGFLQLVGKESYIANTFKWSNVRTAIMDVEALAGLVKNIFEGD